MNSADYILKFGKLSRNKLNKSMTEYNIFCKQTRFEIILFGECYVFGTCSKFK